MELTIEMLRRIRGHGSIPNPKKTPSISAPEDPALADVSDDSSDRFSDPDDYFSEDESDCLSYLNTLSVAVDDDYFSDYDEDGEKKKPVKVEELEPGIFDQVERNWRLFGYTVRVDGHRILTLATTSNDVLTRWLKEVLRCFRGKRGSDKIVVGVVVGERRGRNDFIQLCIGSQCLIYELPAFYDVDYKRCPLHEFFANRRVVAAGVNMSAVAKKMSNERNIEFANVMDLNEFAVEALENGYELDLKKYDLDRLGKTVLGKRWYVERPEKPIKWMRYYHYFFVENRGIEKVKHATYDAYTSYMIATKLLEMKSERNSAASAEKKSNKKKGNR